MNAQADACSCAPPAGAGGTRLTLRRVGQLAAAVALTATTTVSGAGTARAAGALGYCPDGNGVTVVVDFQQLGGGVVIRCAAGDQPTGLAALENAGFTVTGTVRWGKAFVCRINGRPGIAVEPCIDTPPASAYWSYWHAPNGGRWTYSSQGALARKPPLGSFEGWSFSSGRDENTAPPPAVAPVRPAPPPPPPSAGVRTPAVTPKAGGGTAGIPTGAGAVSVRPPTGGPLAAAPAGEPPSVTATRTPPTMDPAAATGTEGSPNNGGLPPGTVAGAVLLAALTAAAVLTAVRRRRGAGASG